MLRQRRQVDASGNSILKLRLNCDCPAAAMPWRYELSSVGYGRRTSVWTSIDEAAGS
jgi:hypothetical protein